MDEFKSMMEVMAQRAWLRRLMFCRPRESDESPTHNMNVSQTTPRIPRERSCKLITGRRFTK